MTRLLCFLFTEAWKVQSFCLKYRSVFFLLEHRLHPVSCATATYLANYFHFSCWFGGLGFFFFHLFVLNVLSKVFCIFLCWISLPEFLAIFPIYPGNFTLQTCSHLKSLFQQVERMHLFLILKICGKVSVSSLLKLHNFSLLLHPLCQCPSESL